MNIGDTRLEDMTYDKFRDLASLGRRAIELRLVGILIRPHVLTEADNAELEKVKALLSLYSELMDEKYWYKHFPAANDSDGAKG